MKLNIAQNKLKKYVQGLTSAYEGSSSFKYHSNNETKHCTKQV